MEARTCDKQANQIRKQARAYKMPDTEYSKVATAKCHRWPFCKIIANAIQTIQKPKRTAIGIDVSGQEHQRFLDLELSNVCNKMRQCTFEVCSCESSKTNQSPRSFFTLPSQLYRYTSLDSAHSIYIVLLLADIRIAVLICVTIRTTNQQPLALLNINDSINFVLISMTTKPSIEQFQPHTYTGMLCITVELLLQKGIINMNYYIFQLLQFVQNSQTSNQVLDEVSLCNHHANCCIRALPSGICRRRYLCSLDDDQFVGQKSIDNFATHYQKWYILRNSLVTSSLQIALLETRLFLKNLFAIQFIEATCINLGMGSQRKKPGMKMKRTANIMLKQPIDYSYDVKIQKHHRFKWKLHRSMNGFFSDRSSTTLASSENGSSEVQHNDSVHTLNRLCMKQGTDKKITHIESRHGDETQKFEKAYTSPLHKLIPLAPEHMRIPKTDIIVANVLDPIFQQLSDGTNPGPSETMKYELLRLCTFRDYPKGNKPFLIRLSEAGFYYGANGDEVACYCCGYRRHDWTADCVPMAIHRRMSPNCPFLIRNSEVNVPVPDASSATMAKFAFLRELIEEERDNNGNDYAISAVPQPVNHQPSTNTNLQKLNNQPLFANNRIEPPKHPHYGLKTRRLDSYRGWPTESCQDPEVLADAGFYFAGMGDCVRCFQCGVGLRHWTKDDDPWVEHSRWTLENPCPYLIKKKGTEFVELVRMAVDIGNRESESSPQENGIRQSDMTRNNSSSTNETGNTGKMDKSSTAGGQTNTSRAKHHLNDGKRKPTSHSAAQIRGKLSGEQRKIAAENERLRGQTMCKVCFERNVCIVFLPCGHLVTCAECAPTLSVCPVCRKDVKGTVKTYLS